MLIYNKKVMKKSIILCVSMLCSILLIGCGSEAAKDPNTNLIIKKDGSVVSTIHESFEESYYSIDELKAEIDSEVKEYNSLKSGAINVESVELNEKTVTAVLDYSSFEDYASFNDEALFAGSSQEAILKGFPLDVILTDVNNPTVTIAEADIKAMTNEKLLIADISDNIYLPGKILYISDNAQINPETKCVTRKQESTAAIYVVYK